MDFKNKVIVSKSVFSPLQPSIFMARIFGLAPVNYYFNGKHYVIEKSTVCVIYSYVAVTVAVGFAIAGIIHDFDPADSTRLRNTNQRYIVLSDIGIILLGVFLGVIQTPFRLGYFLEIIESINKINLIINESAESNSWQKKVSKIIWFTSEITFAIVVGLDVFAWSQKTIDQEHYFLYLKRYFSFYILYTVTIAQGSLYCNMAYFIKKRFISLNESMKKEIKKSKTIYNLGKEINGALIRSKPLLDSNKILDTTILKTISHAADSEMTVQKVANFMKVHEKLFISVNSINSCYGYAVLFILMSCILHLVITPFYVITLTEPLDLMIIQITWIFVHILRLFMIIESTHSCLAESNKTNPLIVQLFSKTEDSDVRHKIEVFALQGKLCKIQFSSCGVVTLQRSVLASVAGAVTTYLVILIQLNSN